MSRPVLGVLDKEMEQTQFLAFEEIGKREINILAGSQGQATELLLCPLDPISSFMIRNMVPHQALHTVSACC